MDLDFSFVEMEKCVLFLAQADYEHQSIRTAVTQEIQFHIENTEISGKHLMPVDSTSLPPRINHITQTVAIWKSHDDCLISTRNFITLPSNFADPYLITIWTSSKIRSQLGKSCRVQVTLHSPQTNWLDKDFLNRDWYGYSCFRCSVHLWAALLRATFEKQGTMNGRRGKQMRKGYIKMRIHESFQTACSIWPTQGSVWLPLNFLICLLLSQCSLASPPCASGSSPAICIPQTHLIKRHNSMPVVAICCNKYLNKLLFHYSHLRDK